MRNTATTHKKQSDTRELRRGTCLLAAPARERFLRIRIVRGALSHFSSFCYAFFSCFSYLLLLHRDRKELEVRIQALQQQYGSINDGAAPIECLEGESAGDYSVEWTSTFDLVFLILMGVLLAALCVWTEMTHPELWTNYWFWLEQTPKLGLMMFVSLGGGLLCRYFCRIDEDGYIITSKSDTFKVNYTRKLQHFAAYLIPLLMHTHAAKDIEGQCKRSKHRAATNRQKQGTARQRIYRPPTHIHSMLSVLSFAVCPPRAGPLTLTWGNWFTLLGFMILIKPIRERSTFVMLQFNSLDRPEDRPNTLSWIVGGNILPGCVMIIFFKCQNTQQSDTHNGARNSAERADMERPQTVRARSLQREYTAHYICLDRCSPPLLSSSVCLLCFVCACVQGCTPCPVSKTWCTSSCSSPVSVTVSQSPSESTWANTSIGPPLASAIENIRGAGKDRLVSLSPVSSLCRCFITRLSRHCSSGLRSHSFRRPWPMRRQPRRTRLIPPSSWELED